MIAILIFASLYCLLEIVESYEEGDLIAMRIYLLGLVLSVATLVSEIQWVERFK